MRFLVALAVLLLGLAALAWNHDIGASFGIDNDQFAQLALFGTFAVLVGAGLAGQFRHRLWAGAKAGAVWIGIACGLMIGYTFGPELWAGTMRVAGAVLPGTVVETGETGSVMVMRSRDGHFRVKALVNGKSLSMLVDTGASDVVLSARDARAVGLDPDSLRFDARISTANGATYAAPAVIRSLAVGSLTEVKIRALVAKDGALDTSLLGNSFLSRLKSYAVEGDRLSMKK